jgi:hypothetical protein
MVEGAMSYKITRRERLLIWLEEKHDEWKYDYPTPWRCRLRIHDMSWEKKIQYDYYGEPDYDTEWVCLRCEVEREYEDSIGCRFWEWAWNTRLGNWYIEREMRKDDDAEA